MKIINTVTLVLVIVGAINWGLVGIARLDLVATIFGLQFGEVSILTAAVYTLVALSGLYQAVSFRGQQEQPATTAFSTR
jgi:uncharacterized protein